MMTSGPTTSHDAGLLPLPLGEGWGEGLRSPAKAEPPSPGSPWRSDLSPPGKGEPLGSHTDSTKNHLALAHRPILGGDRRRIRADDLGKRVAPGAQQRGGKIALDVVDQANTFVHEG